MLSTDLTIRFSDEYALLDCVEVSLGRVKYGMGQAKFKSGADHFNCLNGGVIGFGNLCLGQLLRPVVLEQGPDSFHRVECRAVRREIYGLDLIVFEEPLDSIACMGRVVIHHYPYLGDGNLLAAPIVRTVQQVLEKLQNAFYVCTFLYLVKELEVGRVPANSANHGVAFETTCALVR